MDFVTLKVLYISGSFCHISQHIKGLYMVSSCNLRDSQLESKVITDYHHVFVYYDQLSTQYHLSKEAKEVEIQLNNGNITRNYKQPCSLT
jgi:hypothetical protein